MGSQTLNKYIGKLNFSGILATPLSQTDVIQPLSQLDESAALKILHDLESRAGSIRDPTKYVLKAISNAGTGGGAQYRSSPSGSWGADSWGYVDDGKTVSKQVGWLNHNVSLAEPLSFNDVIGPLSTVGTMDAMKILKDLETNAASIKNPTGYVMKAVNNVTGRPVGGGAMPRNVSLPPTFKLDPTGKIGRTIGWINHNAGLQQPVSYSEVVGALSGCDIADAMKILKDLGEKGKDIQNPTSYVMAAASRASSWGGGNGGGGWVDETKKISRKIYELNQSGALQKMLSHSDTIDLLSAIHPSQATKILGDLEKKAQSIKEPTAYVYKAAQNAGGTMSGPAVVTMPNVKGGGTGGTDAKEISRQIGKLNHAGSLQGAISHTDVIGPLSTLPGLTALKILGDLEKRSNEVQNPTGYILKAAGNAGAQIPETLSTEAPAKRAHSALQGGGPDLAPGDYGKMISKAVGRLNHYAGLAQPITYSEVKSHLESLDIDSAQKVLEDLEKQSYKVKDPTNYIVRAAKRIAAGEDMPIKKQRSL
eukprot:gnl/MRDRNA2_/MRDRNA2_81405_c0_seq1.p1 gnl/MRDRNA2_/MRDRNA2_81405_c0~~gnl/MRDRNA2_/MRDRNA2_81405_c0_seq1.p1  ORF type:complete len:535 (+),score=109.53 gnl/MRDRNA2_/MRDRNA2_81405_c0_seq1:108-1712(+)